MDSFYLLFLGVAYILSVVESKWSTSCPKECVCKETRLSQTPLGRWLLNNDDNDLDPASKFRTVQKDSLIRSATCTVEGSTTDDFFAGLPHDTQVLVLSQSKGTTPLVLRDRMFRTLPGLIGLEVSGYPTDAEKLVSLSNDAFQTATKLQYLLLQHVNVTDSESVFGKLTGLKVLKLVHNGLQSLPPNAFRGLFLLEELSIEWNRIRSLPPTIFSSLYNLRHLSLRYNSLHCFENCSGNRQLSRLQALDLSNNNITQISSLSFLPMPSLSALDVRNNPIQVLFPYSFQSIGHLRRLDIGHRRQPLHIMPFSFIGLHGLTDLNLPNVDNNVLEYGMFAGLSSLQSLSVQGKVQQITNNAFFSASDLVRLTLQDCRLRRIARNAFVGLKKLQHLDLSGNRLVKIHHNAFTQLKALQELRLQGNQLKDVPRRLFVAIPLKSLRLEANPWNCTCEMSKWREAVVAKIRKESETTSAWCAGKEISQNDALSATKCVKAEAKYIRDPKLIPTCATPLQYKGQSVFDVVKKQMKCFKKKRLHKQ